MFRHHGTDQQAEPAAAESPLADTSPTHPLSRFIGIGGIATIVQLGMMAGLVLIIEESWANLIAWSVSTAIANAAHRRITFGVHDRAGARRDLLVATGFSVVALILSTAVLNNLNVENALGAVLVLVAVNTVVGGVRYVALHWWYSNPGHRGVAQAISAPFAAA